jgi:hypothetical protein
MVLCKAQRRCALQSTEALCALRSIFNFKSKIINPKNFISKSNFIFFRIFLLFFFLMKRK